MKKKKIAIVVILFLILIGTAYLGVNYYIDSLISKTSVEQEPFDNKELEKTIVEDNTEKSHKVINFMLVGADNLDRTVGRENSYHEERSDVFKIVSLDYTDKKIKITSLDRDVVVWIPDRLDFGHFNWAYSYGGAKYALNTINYNLDLDVSKYVSFSFAGFIKVIDIIGGIDVELSEAEANAFNKMSSSSRSMNCAYIGVNHLDGRDALTYARERHIDSDFVRMDRQNVVIKEVINKLKSSSFDELLDVINTCLPYITTNLTNKEIKNFLLDVIGFDLVNIETQTYPKDRQKDVCVNTNSLGGYLVRSYSNQVIELHKYIYGTETYTPTQNIYNNEKETYDKYGNFYENSSLLP